MSPLGGNDSFGSCASGTILPKGENGDFGGDDDVVVDDDDDVESAHDGWAVRGRLSHGLQPSYLLVLPPMLCSNFSCYFYCYFYCSFYSTWYYTPSALFTPTTPISALVFLPLLLLLFWYPGCWIAGTLQAHCRHNIGYTHSALLDVKVVLWLCGCLTRAIMQ